ncbi:MAG: hypothetical protein R2729_20235 [Bryobacteraceae bacterium]
MIRILAVAMGFCLSAAAQDPGFPTGPAVGEKIPSFSLPDQNGRKQNLRSLTGPKGLVLAFVRSADW